MANFANKEDVRRKIRSASPKKMRANEINVGVKWVKSYKSYAGGRKKPVGTTDSCKRQKAERLEKFQRQFGSRKQREASAFRPRLF